ncbi:hypothetical protein OG381_12175 [Streptomyces sp. NBC_00490]|uniref:hypothetical protein n=1 Tax=Streptomyces sp. NBC_00490 TaxID=2903657 RepID=UPI002E17D9B2
MLTLIADGQPNGVVANRLGLSPRRSATTCRRSRRNWASPVARCQGRRALSSRSARWSATSCELIWPSGRYQVDRWWTEPK